LGLPRPEKERQHYTDLRSLWPFPRPGGRRAFSGPAVTVKTPDINTPVRELAHSRSEWWVMIVDADGTLVIPQGLPLPG
jgi:regulator of RNase E activity RraA